MRLRWLHLLDDRFEGGRLSVQFGDVTAFWGPNDAGKSTVLTTIASALWHTKNDGLRPEDGVLDVAVELTATEAEALAEAHATDFADRGNHGTWDFGPHMGRLDGRAETRPARRFREARGTGTVREAWIALGLEGSSLSQETHMQIAEWARDRAVLRLNAHEDGTFVAWWAVPGYVAGTSEPWQPIAPASVVPLTAVSLPTPVLAPLDWESLNRSVAEVADLVVAAAEYDDGAWFPDEDSSSEHLFAGVLRLLGPAATRRAPAFAQRDYALRVQGVSTDIRILIHRSDGLEFEPGSLAQGLQLWYALALDDVLGAFRAVADALVRIRDEDPGNEALIVLIGELVDSHPLPVPSAALEALATVERTWSALPTSMIDGSDPLTDVVQHALERTPRLYVIDEPERHLHPALQREAADWLRTLAHETNVNVVFATHSAPMLGMPSYARLVHVERSANFHIRIEEVDPRDLDAVDRRMSEMGMDRGEALALHRAVLFVEGETDRAVLEVLCQESLRDAAILVQPFRGAKKAQRIVEAETLLRVLGPPFHVLLDHVDAETLSDIEGATLEELDRGLEARRWRDEQDFAATLRRSALHQGRPISLHSIPQRDVLGLLHDDAIRQAVLETGWRGPRYPGFEALVERHGDKYNNELSKYGIRKDAALFRRCAEIMRETGARAPELDLVVDRVWAQTAGVSD